MKSFEVFENNFSVPLPSVKAAAVKAIQTAALTYFTGYAVQVIDTVKTKQDKRTKLQAGLELLQSSRAAEDQLDQCLRAAVDKNLRV